MIISLGADERLPIVEDVYQYLKEQGNELIWHGPEYEQSVLWVLVAQRVAEDVANRRANEGIIFCWTGTGVTIAANKVPGIRAALCVDAETARGARLWNNANILCLSIRLTSIPVAREILKMWFATSYQPNPSDDSCLDIITQIENLYLHKV